ncbi:methionine-tRNA ligase [Pneumocystis carinii B80]|uniref:methionine--tRNA ligase n=1 Tax=Pneumocystis carinii (strain B80) TaxID=1408658 RepID=A0A0W4ZNB8_PNEC8|nr:methionine-tRNA ligase [Pneumocystis carinii B80]KTW29874.1 methionine-tRNA ligase [Pneumocystis carinii B80]
MAFATIQIPPVNDSSCISSFFKVILAIKIYNIDAVFFIGDLLQCIVSEMDVAKSLNSADHIVEYFYQQSSKHSCFSQDKWEDIFGKMSLDDTDVLEIDEIAARVLKESDINHSNVTGMEIILFSKIFFFKKKSIEDHWDLKGQLGQWYKRLSEREDVLEAIRVMTEFSEKKLVFPVVENPEWFKAFADPNRRLRISLQVPFYPKERLPKKGEKNILITSALPYVNNVPHLGNIVGSVLSADVFSRYCKARSLNTIYICGTDEYGTATETKALEQNISPKELCDKYHKIHSEIYKWFEIEFDIFGRTTTQKQTEIASDIFMDLYRNGFLEERMMRQLYCEKHKGFLADRYVEGICPKCSYIDARGDQCDSCGNLLDPLELKEPRCKLDGEKPVENETRHIFILLNKLQPEVEEWIKESYQNGKWSSNGMMITSNFLKIGLEPRCITRDLKWGTPVSPEVPNMQEKVLYVWFDATIGYISITANYTERWDEWWKNPEDVKLYQFMGKDNVPFHTIIFPASLIGTRKKWTMLHHLSTTEYLQYEGGKFSKSRGVGVFGNNARDTNVPPSVWRYYLLISRPEVSDTVFSWKEFIQRNNTELLANLGNFVNRVVKFVNVNYQSIIPHYTEYNDDSNDGSAFIQLERDINKILAQYIENMDAVKIRYSLRLVLEFSSRGNLFLQTNKLDNSLLNNNPKLCSDIIGYMVNLIYLISACVSPFMPSTSNSILQQLNLPQKCISNTWKFDIMPGHKIHKAQYLFSKIPEEKETLWRNQYGTCT